MSALLTPVIDGGKLTSICINSSAADSGGAGGAKAPWEVGCSEKGRSLISAYWSLAITTNTPRFKKLSMELLNNMATCI